MPGVQTCSFTLRSSGCDVLIPVPVCGKARHFEALFCLEGRLVVESFPHDLHIVEAPGIFLLSDSSRIRSCLCSENLNGIFVAVDAHAARQSLRTICSALDIELDTRGVREKMKAMNGYTALSGTPWVQAFFEITKHLPDYAKERYCVFKSVELLYLLCSEIPGADASEPGSGGISHKMLEIRDYMQEHLSDKLTIRFLCRKFLVSPTFLKESFRRAYGMPIHTWLIRQRIKRARELICTTQMPVHDVAHAVGYESISQFNTAFKGYYGMTPGQYRKMSETVVSSPFRQ